MADEFVWAIGFDEVAGYIIEREYLDGDVDKIEYVDTTPDHGSNPLFEPGRMYAGRPVRPDFIPTRMVWKNKDIPPYDFFMSNGLILVSDAFKEIVERHEPGVHQFFPIDVMSEDGQKIGRVYFFNFCNRLDSVDPNNSTAKKGKLLWKPRTGKMVYSKNVIGERHAWVDKYVSSGRFLSNAVKEDVVSAGLTGIVFNARHVK
ncbi:imm11 family protein [Roseibium sp.]|uniref:imm11 family protein n=1 Tax=Roseibium sp. TaxID=1936156 RepID=UPI003BAF1155